MQRLFRSYRSFPPVNPISPGVRGGGQWQMDSGEIGGHGRDRWRRSTVLSQCIPVEGSV